MGEDDSCNSPFPISWNLRTRWGFEWFRTRGTYGLGVELSLRHRPVIALRVGSFTVSFGKQIVWPSFTTEAVFVERFPR